MRVLGGGLSAIILGLALLGLGCKSVVEAPSGLAYGVNPATYVTGRSITPNSPTHSGGAVDSYSVTPALPGGLSLDVSTGVISGTPSAASALASYTVTAANSGGNATASLSITVSDPALPITITTQPASQSVLVGLTATFSVTATGSGTLSYQWQKSGTAISGATSASYTTPVLTLADSGSTFGVTVSDTFGGTALSTTATLTVLAATPNTFTKTGSPAIGRTYHTATLLNDGTVLIAGGSDLSASLPSAELYDPATALFKSTGSLQSQRLKHTATLLANGKVLIVGGIISAGTSTTTLASAEIYDPKAGTFTLTKGSLKNARSEHTATLLPNGKVLVVSGRNGSTYPATAELYDPATDAFADTLSAPLSNRATHTATLLNNGKVLIAGGNRSGNLNTAELYDPATDAFTATGILTMPRALHTATLLPNGKVLLVGGAATLAAELFDSATGTNGGFTATTGNLLTGRAYGHTAALLPSGKVLVAGGLGTGTLPLVLAAAELFDPASGAFTATSGIMTTPREHHSATLLSTGKVLICAGDEAIVLASAELYY